MSKSIAKTRKKWHEDDYDEFDRVYMNKNKKTHESVEVKKAKNRTISKLKNLSREEMMDLYNREEEFF